MVQTGHAVRFEDYIRMSDVDRRAQLVALVGDEPRPAGVQRVKDLDDKIDAFVLKHRMSSSKMRAQVNSGELEETPDIAAWLFYFDLRTFLLEAPSSQTATK